MKKILMMGAVCLFSLSLISCSTNDVKEISGTLLFKDIGDHDFHINADNIKATITIAAPNKGETKVFENVTLYRTSNYHARIASQSTGALKSELLNNLVVMCSAEGNSNRSKQLDLFEDPGYIRIEWKGFN